MAIISILISVAIPIYNRSIIRSKESVLKNNLFTLRTVLDEYTYDKQKAPQTLDDLVSAGYLRTIPVDPMTGDSDFLANHPGGRHQHGGSGRARHLRRAQRIGQDQSRRYAVLGVVT